MNLAIKGGSPVRRKPYHSWPLQDEGVRSQLNELFEQGEWGSSVSSMIDDLEKKIAWYHDAKFAVGVINTTAAFEAALQALGVGPGDEVLIPAYAHHALPVAVISCGGVPIFSDIRQESLDIDPESIDRRVTERTKALIVSHPISSVANMDAVMVMARRYQVKVIEDCTEATGAEFDSRKVGSIGNLGVFSFRENNLLVAGHGAVVISNNKDLYEICYARVHEGRRPEQKTDQEFIQGKNRAMTSLQAAVLLPQCAKLENLNILRAVRFAKLSELLQAVPGIKIYERQKLVTRQALEGFAFRYDAASFNQAPRTHFINALNAEGIPARAGHALAYENRNFQLKVDQCPYRCRFYPLPYYLAKCPVAKEASETAVVLDHTVLLDDEQGLTSIPDAINKLSQNKHELC
ncbi:DegT/DnrJ/EryC1/StrS family aminotransferase [Acidobacteriota bacterium]